MAKKKTENTLSYLQMPLPQGGKYSKMTKVAFGGLNKRYTIDSGDLSMECNISTNEYPYLTPSSKKTPVYDTYKNPTSMFAFDDFLVVVYTKNGARYIDYITSDVVHTGILKESGATATSTPRSIVQFNVYDTPTDPLTGQYVKKLLIFPDKASMYMNIVEADSNPADWEEEYAKADEDKKANTALMSADLNVMYYCENDNKQKYYYTVGVKKNTDADGKVTYSRYVQCKSLDKDGNETPNYFFCDGMEALVKEYTNDTDPYLPPDTASHNYYYKNLSTKAKEADTLYGSAIYRWVDDNSDSEKSGWKISIPPAIPNLKYATVHLSRVFGVDDDRVYASGYNNYANWNLDTVDEYNEANAWCSPSQSNTKAGGCFTGITSFQNHIICFKHDFMHEIYNTKNPFRLQDIYAEGTIDNRTIQDVDGKLIFVSEDDVKIYTGSNPRIIGYNLNMPKYTYAVSGTDNRNYYLYCEENADIKHLFVYDTYTELWSEQSVEDRVLSFAHNKNGMYMLCKDADNNGTIYKMDTVDYSHEWSFETDLVTNKPVNIKHIKKLQMLVELAKDADMQVYILYDDEEFEKMSPEEREKRLAYTVAKTDKSKKFPIRVKPRKTANYGFKLHFKGSGYIKLYELEIFVESGGDLYV